MAFAAMEIVAGYVGSAARRGDGHPLLAKVTGSQSMPTPGTSNVVAPPPDASRGQPVFYVLANAPSYVAVGSSPDASQSPRIPVQANVPQPVYAEPGDKIAWVAA